MKATELRQSILQAAVQGKLVPQDANDEPASKLLKRIQQEKARLIKEGKIKKEKPLSPIAVDEIPYDLPNGWVWCRLGEIGETNIGLTYKPSNISVTGVSVMRSNNIQNGKMNYDEVVFVKKDVSERAMLQIGDILICARNGSRRLVGKTAIVDKAGMAFGAFMAMFRSICNSYINVYLSSMLFRANMNNPQTTTINQITQDMLKNTIFPLPPFAEQQCIVTKVNELMALCDELETAEKELETLEDHFAEYLPKSILQAAVQGKLVPQNATDEPATKLLKRIQQEKTRLIKDGKIKKEKPLSPITKDEIPYDLPKGWTWCRLGDVFLVNMGQSPDGSSVSEEGEGIEFHQGKSYFSHIFLEMSPYITNQPTKIANPSDILLAVRAPVGVVNITMRQICIGRGLCALESLGDIDSKFMFYFLKPMEDYFNKQATGTTFRAISAEIVKTSLFPLPPLAEQQRIVVKLNELMALCDELKFARKFTSKSTASKIIPFPQQDDNEELLIAARGNAAKGLSAKAQRDVDKLFGNGGNE